MKKLLFSLAAVCLAAFTSAQNAPLWLRHCAISPDGTTIAFTYKGDIYTVPVDGGRAMQLTTNPAHDTEPVWSPDGKRIAFASDRMGSMDVYIAKIRKYLADDPSLKILTIHGEGFKLVQVQ